MFLIFVSQLWLPDFFLLSCNLIIIQILIVNDADIAPSLVTTTRFKQ